MFPCGECTKISESREERALHRTKAHNSSRAFTEGGFCAFCRQKAPTIYACYDHLLEKHEDRWKMLEDRWDAKAGVELMWLDLQYPVAEAAFSHVKEASLSIADIMARIDEMATQQNGAGAEAVEIKQEVNEEEVIEVVDEDTEEEQVKEDEEQDMDKTIPYFDDDDDDVQILELETNHANFSRSLLTPISEVNTQISTSSHPVLASLLNERVGEKRIDDSSTRKRSNAQADHHRSSRPPEHHESAQKRLRPLDIPQGDDLTTSAFLTPERGSSVFSFNATSIKTEEEDTPVLQYTPALEYPAVLQFAPEEAIAGLAHLAAMGAEITGVKKEERDIYAGADEMSDLDAMFRMSTSKLQPMQQMQQMQQMQPTQQLHVQSPITPASSCTGKIDLLTPESSIPPTLAPFECFEDDKFKIEVVDISDVGSSCGSGSQVSSYGMESLTMQQNALLNMQNMQQLLAANPQFKNLFYTQQQQTSTPMQLQPMYLPTSAAVAAAPAAPFAPFMPIVAEEKDPHVEFWNLNGPGNCPTCRWFNKGPADSKRIHYKKMHYPTYFEKARNKKCMFDDDRLKTLMQFLGMRLGDDKSGQRVCLWCKDTRFRSGRVGMIEHLITSHPVEWHQLQCDYNTLWNDYVRYAERTPRSPDPEIHGMLLFSRPAATSTPIPCSSSTWQMQ